MLTPEQLDKYPDNLVRLYSNAEKNIIEDIARRIATYDYFIPSAEWQYKKLIEMGNVEAEILETLSKMTGYTKPELTSLMEDAGYKAIKADDEIYKKAGLNPPPLGQSPALMDVLNAGIKNTNGLFENLTRTTARTASKQFEHILDRAYMQISTGAFDYNTAIKFAIKDLARNGIASIEYPGGRINYIEAAVRRAVLTGVNQTALKMQDIRADEMGCDLVETSAHAGARPSHARWQGKIFSRSGNHPKYPNFKLETGYGTGAGLGGWNCRHNWYPFFEGFSEPTNSRQDLKDMNAKDYEYNGEKLTEYETTQKQRAIERNIRRWKREYVGMNAAGLSTDGAAAKITQWQNTQKDFLKQTGLKQQIDREQIAGFGKSEAQKVIQYNKAVANRANKMYNLGSTEDNIKAYKRDEPIRNKIQSNEIIKDIESGKQGKHILGHNNYIPGRSYLTITEKEAQELVNEYAGTGKIIRDRNDRWNNKEIISVNHDIGINVDLETGEETTTNRFVIHYSKKGIHIVPVRKEE